MYFDCSSLGQNTSRSRVIAFEQILFGTFLICVSEVEVCHSWFLFRCAEFRHEMTTFQCFSRQN